MKKLAMALLSVLSLNAFANDYDQLRSTPIPFYGKGHRTILNQEYELPEDGTVFTRILHLKAGQVIAPHIHQAPVFITVLKGTIELDYGNKNIKVLQANTGYVEAINHCHKARVLGDTDVDLHLLMVVDEDHEDLAKSIDCKFSH